jgi:Zn-dependent peptidase ImmA (M78 family)
MKYLEAEIAHSPVKRPEGLLRRLRKLGIQPRYQSAGWLTAQRIAAKQGGLLAREARRSNTTVVSLVANLPGIIVEIDHQLPVSGLAVWSKSRRAWLIKIRAADSLSRQRFTLLHEFKHIIDHGNMRLYDPRLFNGHFQKELAADLFASASLMPARLVRTLTKRHGLSSTEIAQQLLVSRDRVRLRLSDLNLANMHNSERSK